MHPILFTFPDWLPLLGGHSIHVYGVMIAVGFLIGMQWVKYESKRVGLDQDKVMDLFFYIMIAGLVGSRILYIINSVPDFWSDPLVIIRVWEGGLVFQGGVIASFFTMIYYLRNQKMSFYKVADVFVPALSIGHAIGRVGCFFAGCCYGKPAPDGFFWTLIFPQVQGGIAPAGVSLYPTQPMEALGEVIIFLMLVTYRKKKPFDGAIFLLYLILYSILRSFIEVIRGDLVRGFVIPPYVSVAQGISFVAIVASLVTWCILAKKAKKSQA